MSSNDEAALLETLLKLVALMFGFVFIALPILAVILPWQLSAFLGLTVMANLGIAIEDGDDGFGPREARGEAVTPTNATAGDLGVAHAADALDADLQGLVDSDDDDAPDVDDDPEDFDLG